MRNTVHFSPVHRALAALAACAALAFAQTRTPGEQPPASGVIRVDVELVNLLCTVQDRSGAYVTDLSQDDFTVLEDGRRQPITHFARQTDQALTVALLFDVSWSMDTSLNAESDAARQFFRSILRPGDSAMLVGFAAFVALWQPVTSSAQVLEQALDQVPEVGKALRDKRMSVLSKTPIPGPRGGMMIAIGGDGGSKLFDAVDLVSTRHLRQLPGRKAIIALTDGKDEGSERSLQEAVRSTLAADAIFFGIEPKEKLGDRMDVLKELSSKTGGSAFNIDNHTTLDAALRAIEEQLRNQYAIGYAPPDNSKKGTFHKLEVRVNKPGYTVRVRSGYVR
jgi:VWFA-related protein